MKKEFETQHPECPCVIKEGELFYESEKYLNSSNREQIWFYVNQNDNHYIVCYYFDDGSVKIS